jgi:fluoride exporter
MADSGYMTQPMDSDVDLRVPAQRREAADVPWPVLGAISAGGVLGALARYGIGVAWPHQPGGFPWATFLINVTGCLLIGVLMVMVTQVWTGRRLLRPFLGVGVLGGFTTFSTYTVDIQKEVSAGAPRTALAYLAATLVAALLGVWTGSAAARRLVGPRRRRPGRAPR